MATLRYTKTDSTDKSPFDYMAGGKFWDAQYAGNSLFDVSTCTKLPNFTEKKTNLNRESLTRIMQTDALPIIYDLLPIVKLYENTKSWYIDYTITATNEDGDEETISNTIYDSDGYADYDAPTRTANLDELQSMFNNQWDIRTINPISLTFTLVSSLWNDEVSFTSILGGATIGTFTNIVSNGLTEVISKAIGVTDIFQALGIGAIISTIIGEAFEVAVGLDRSFGFGGDYIGTIAGVKVYEEEKDIVTGIKEYFGEMFGNTYSDFATDYDGNLLGQINAKYTFTTSTLGEFNRLTRNIYGDDFTDLSYELVADLVKDTWEINSEFGDLGMADEDVRNNALNTDDVFGTDYSDYTSGDYSSRGSGNDDGFNGDGTDQDGVGGWGDGNGGWGGV